MRYDLEVLEFFKILDILEKNAITLLAKNEIKEIKPTNNLPLIIKELDEVKDAFNSIVKYDTIPLVEVGNIKQGIVIASLGGILSISDLLNISLFLSMVIDVTKYYKNLNNQKIEVISLNEYFLNLSLNESVKKEIDLAIDERGFVLDTASDELYSIRKKISSEQNKLRSKMNELLLSKSQMLTDSIIVIRNNRLCLPVKSEYKNTFGGIVHDESSSKTTCYIEPKACVDINNLIESLLNQEKKEVEKVLHRLSVLVGKNSESINIDIDIIIKLDIIYAKAKLAINDNMVYPKVNEKGYINLIDARHPLIPRNSVVPTSIYIGKDFNTIIITGPNTGGKTVVLKTVGLLTLMMQCGMFIPASQDSELAIFDNIFVDIGDEQSIEQSLSTFSSHMKKICNIVNNITDNSLVLLDEIGSGTDPKEGASLAISIINYIKNNYARLITTTHYSDLKAYAYSNNDICNASVEFDSETLNPTYKLLMGIPGKSNALLIAKRLGLKEEIIENAKSLISNMASDNQVLMEKLDAENAKISSIKTNYEHMINEYNVMTNELIEEKNKLANERDKILNKALKEADEILLKAKNDSLEIISQLDNMKKNESFKEHELASIKHSVRTLSKNEIQEKLFNDDLEVGDYVFINSYNKEGSIISIKKNKYEVKMGQFTMLFNKNELKKISKPNKPKPKVSKMVKTVSSNAKLELDLRGYRYEEVASEIDSFIDNAYLSNMSMISIIHGFGTGAVRDAVQSYLKKSPYVKSYRYGGEGEGLNGVTIVYLK